MTCVSLGVGGGICGQAAAGSTLFFLDTRREKTIKGGQKKRKTELKVLV